MNPENLKLAKDVAAQFAAPRAAINGIHGDAMAAKVEDGKAAISGICVITGKTWTAYVSAEGWKMFQEDRTASIRDCWPGIIPDDAEWLISGISPEGWERMYGKN